MPELAPILLGEHYSDDVGSALCAFQQPQFAHPIDVAGDGVKALD